MNLENALINDINEAVNVKLAAKKRRKKTDYARYIAQGAGAGAGAIGASILGDIKDSTVDTIKNKIYSFLKRTAPVI